MNAPLLGVIPYDATIKQAATLLNINTLLLRVISNRSDQLIVRAISLVDSSNQNIIGKQAAIPPIVEVKINQPKFPDCPAIKSPAMEPKQNANEIRIVATVAGPRDTPSRVRHWGQRKLLIGLRRRIRQYDAACALQTGHL